MSKQPRQRPISATTFLGPARAATRKSMTVGQAAWRKRIALDTCFVDLLVCDMQPGGQEPTCLFPGRRPRRSMESSCPAPAPARPRFPLSIMYAFGGACWVVSSMWMLPACSCKSIEDACAGRPAVGDEEWRYLALVDGWSSSRHFFSAMVPQHMPSQYVGSAQPQAGRKGPCSLQPIRLHTASQWLRELASLCRVQKIKRAWLQAKKETLRHHAAATATCCKGAWSSVSPTASSKHDGWRCSLGAAGAARCGVPVDSCHVPLFVALALRHHTRHADDDGRGADVEC